MNMHVKRNGLGHIPAEGKVLQYYRNEAQAFHGERVEERQRVNGQDNGYTGPITEAELHAMKDAPSKTYKPTHGGYPGLTRTGNPY